MSVLDPLSSLKNVDDVPGAYPSADRPDRRIVWEWNLPLLLISSLVLVALAVALVSLYLWQSQRLSAGLLLRAQSAEQQGDSQQQVKWLTRYVGLRANDVDAQIELALTLDALVTTADDLDPARRRLNAALIACGDSPGYEQQKELLRGKLIERMLQFGPLWAQEVEKQVFAIEAPAGDPQATKWLAQSLIAQQGDSQYTKPPVSQLDRQEDYWKWLVSQPLGQVMIIALEANPDDVDLASSFFNAIREHRDWFDTVDKPADSGHMDELAKQTIERLRQQTNNGRAQLVAYAYLLESNSPEARSVVDQALQPALSRLAEFDESEREAEAAKGGTDSQVAKSSVTLDSLATVIPLPSSSTYQPYWDWQLASEAARFLAVDGEQSQAQEIYVRLLDYSSASLPQPQREATYVAYGGLLAAKEGIPAAIEQWKLGQEQYPQSLDLARMLAIAYTTQQELTLAQESVDKLRSIVESQRDRLDGIYGSQLPTAAKQSIRLVLDFANWEVLLLQARLAVANNDLIAASDLSLQAFASPLILDSQQRLQAGRLLAECYTRRQLWDMAAQTLDRCVNLSPNDSTLQRAAASAWQNSGTSDRTSQQFEKLDDGSFDAALEIARLKSIAEGAKAAEQADMAAVAKAIQLARQRYEQATPEAQASMRLWQLELLELNLPSSEADTTKLAKLRLDRLEQIAANHADVPDVQMLVAVTLAAAGRDDASHQVIARLQELAARTGMSQDLTNLTLTQASIRYDRGETAEAIQDLRAAMQAIPDQRLQLAKAGAELALRSKQSQLAYDLLSSIPQNDLDISTLMLLARVATSLSATDSGLATKLNQDLTRWIDQLVKLEGAEGTHWRYLKAQQLLDDVLNAPDRQQRLDQASRLFNEIDARRPRWGMAAALGGRIAAYKGLTDEAITLLRRAVHDGDSQVSTVWQLVQELKAVGRFDEAEQELQRLGSSSASILPVSAMMIELAQGRGDFNRSLDVARELVSAQPLEVTSWLLLSQSLFSASTKTSLTPDEQKSLQQECWQALEKANELSHGQDIKVWGARFRFQLVAGNRSAAEQELVNLQKTNIDPEQRLLAAGQGYLQLNELDKARQLFEGCLAINPKSSAAYLALVDFHNRMGDAAASLEALRRAQAASPEDQALRERLAVSLAFGAAGKVSSSDQHAAEIDKLLAKTNADSTPRSRLVKALINQSQGNPQQQSQALLTMRDIARSVTPEGTDAKRILANYFVRQWLSQPRTVDTPEAVRNFNEAIAFFEQLTSVASASALDVARYIDFMLQAFVVQRDAQRSEIAQAHLAEAEKGLQKLESISGSSLASLQLRVRLAIAQDKRDQIEALTANWVQGAGDVVTNDQPRIWELAGQTLGELGLTDDSIVWLEKVYAQDPSKYQRLVVALAQSKQVNRALELGVAGYHRSPTAEAATLIAEVAMLNGRQACSAEVEQVLSEALEKFNKSPQLLEGVGTVRLLQERFQEAAAWFETVDKLAPKRVRTLNNLAMALSELPMGKEQALKKIEQAIAIQGRMPELLDTHGLVLLRNGKLDEARKVLTEAADASDDPRFQLHLAQVAFAQNEQAAAEQAWDKIDQAKLNETELTTQEQAVLARLKNKQPQAQP